MTTYTHVHHIIPKYMGGDDSKENLIELTIEQHAQAHWELFCMYGNWEDEVAYRSLSGQINHYEAQQEARRNAQYSRWAVPGAREEQSKKVSGENNPQYGKPTSAKQKEAVRIANSVPKPHISENMKKLHAEGKSYKFTSEDVRKAGLASQARKPKWYTNGSDNKYIPMGEEVPEGYHRGRTVTWVGNKKGRPKSPLK